MTHSPTPTPPRDLDLANAIHALRRSARKALEIALQTGTPCYIWQDGRIVNIGAPERVQSPPGASQLETKKKEPK